METMSFGRESISEEFSYPVETTTFDDQSEQRRLTTSKRLIGFKISSPALIKSQYDNRRDFYEARKGGFQTFLFTSPFDSIQYTVKFSGSFSSDLKNGIYYCKYSLQIVDQDET